MPKENFLEIFLFDYAFYDKTVKEYKGDFLLKLMHINANSKYRPRRQNIISKTTFAKIISNELEKSGKKECDELDKLAAESFLKKAFHPFDEPQNIAEIEEDIEKNIKIAIQLASTEQPYQTIIFTNDEEINNYKENSHYQNVKGISVKSRNDAIQYLEEGYKMVTDTY